MASVIELEDGRNGYVDLVHHVMERGTAVSPRGMLTREIEDAVVVIHNVYDTLPLGVGRGANAGVGSIEAMQLLAGATYPDLLMRVAPQFRDYAEADGQFWGAYGIRTGYQVQHVIDRLKDDPDTRQAVMTFWNPELDLEPGKKDYPCTILHQYRIRDGALNLSVYMRSNDVWKGAAYDFFQFTRMQLAIAGVLGIEPGVYSHHVGSLHIYETDFDKIEKLTYADAEAAPAAPVLTGSSWKQVRALAKQTLDAVEDGLAYLKLNAAQRWYADAMITSVKRNAQRG